MTTNKFWKTVKSIPLDKPKFRNTISLTDNRSTKVYNSKIAAIFSNYFLNIVRSLKIAEFQVIDNLLTEKTNFLAKKNLSFFKTYFSHINFHFFLFFFEN